MYRKLYLLFLSAGLCGFGTIQAQWIQEKSPTRDNLNAISLTANNSCWIVGDHGTILYKKFGEWKIYQGPTDENLHSVFMITEINGWAVGDNGTIIQYDGRKWKSFESPTKMNLLSVYFKDAENGIAVGEFGTILTYMKGTWNVVLDEYRGDFFTAFMGKDDTWIGGGLECVNVPIMKMDFDANLAPIDKFNSLATISGLFLLDSYNGWAVGSPSILLHYDGNRWEKSLLDYKFPSLKSVFFIDKNNGISVGYGGTILVFSGDQWNKEKSITTQNLMGTSINENSFYAVGDSGTILIKYMATNDILPSLTEQNIEGIEVFPNPCDGFLNLRLLDKKVNDMARISIINSNGQVMMQKKLNHWNGYLTDQITTSEFKSGLYFMQVISADKITTVKFIIAH